MNYVEKIKNDLDNELKMGDDYKQLLDLYTLLVFTKGNKCTNKNVHDAWGIWQTKTMSNHKSLVPFKKLDKKIQDLDTMYKEAIIKIYNMNKNLIN